MKLRDAIEKILIEHANEERMITIEYGDEKEYALYINRVYGREYNYMISFVINDTTMNEDALYDDEFNYQRLKDLLVDHYHFEDDDTSTKNFLAKKWHMQVFGVLNELSKELETIKEQYLTNNSGIEKNEIIENGKTLDYIIKILKEEANKL